MPVTRFTSQSPGTHRWHGVDTTLQQPVKSFQAPSIVPVGGKFFFAEFPDSGNSHQPNISTDEKNLMGSYSSSYRSRAWQLILCSTGELM